MDALMLVLLAFGSLRGALREGANPEGNCEEMGLHKGLVGKDLLRRNSFTKTCPLVDPLGGTKRLLSFICFARQVVRGLRPRGDRYFALAKLIIRSLPAPCWGAGRGDPSERTLCRPG